MTNNTLLHLLPIELLVIHVFCYLKSKTLKIILNDDNIRKNIKDRYPQFIYRIVKNINVTYLGSKFKSKISLHNLRLCLPNRDKYTMLRMICEHPQCINRAEFLNICNTIDISKYGERMLCWASEHNNLNVVKILLTFPEVENIYHALFLACNYDHTRVIFYLFDHVTEFKTLCGNTLISLTIINNNIEVTRMLLENIYIEPKHLTKCKTLARAHGHDDMLSMLEKY